jgi:hypothetical protein
MKTAVALNWSFHSVEHPQLQRLFQILRPKIVLHSAKICASALEAHAEQVTLKIKAIFEKCDSKISLSLDGWTSSNRLGCLAIVSYHIDNDWNYQEHLIGFEEIEGRHTGVNYLRHLKEVLANVAIEDRIFGLTTDNASNNSTLSEHLEEDRQELRDAEERNEQDDDFQDNVRSFAQSWSAERMHVPCLAHVVQLVVKAFIIGIKANAPSEKVTFARVTDEEIDAVNQMTAGFQRTLDKVCVLILPKSSKISEI